MFCKIELVLSNWLRVVHRQQTVSGRQMGKIAERVVRYEI